MKRFLLLAVAMVMAGIASAQVILQDGFEGPWDFPENTFAVNSGGGGFDEDWFVDHVDWVGDKQFQLDQDWENLTEGEYSQIANSSVNDGNIRDLYIARLVPDVQAGVPYKISLDYRFDKGDHDNHIQYTMRDGDHQTRADINDIEQYTGHDRPDTQFVDDTTFGTQTFHTLVTTHTPAAGETEFTFMMIIRFWSSNLNDNWLWLDNFIVEVETETAVSQWSIY